MPREFIAKKAERKNTPCLFALSGPPGCGKTTSALMLATGIKQDRGGEIYLIDTDGDRALACAPRPGDKPDFKETFDFTHISFVPPFRPSAFKDAIRQFVKPDTAAIIIDTLSSEHEGEGGVLDWHETELQRMAGDDWAKRDKMTQAAWIKPKAERRAMIEALIQIKSVPIIVTFRAREKTKPIKNEQGKVVPTNVGWTPIAPTEIVDMMTVFCLLPRRADGVPMWRGSTQYEDFSIKFPAQFRGVLKEGEAINAGMGVRISRWARGENVFEGAPTTQRQQSPQDARATSDDDTFPGDRKPAQTATTSPTAPLPLETRIAAFLDRMKSAPTKIKADAMWKAAEGLRADVDRADPERLVDMQTAYDDQLMVIEMAEAEERAGA